MKNPFQEFRHLSEPLKGRRIPLDEILESHDSVMAKLAEGYKRLVEDEVGDQVWREDRNSIVQIYDKALEIVQQITWDTGDIEAFCVRSLQSEDSEFFLVGPLGLYLSALCNSSKGDEVSISLNGQELRVPLLGYRLSEGTVLSVEEIWVTLLVSPLKVET